MKSETKNEDERLYETFSITMELERPMLDDGTYADENESKANENDNNKELKHRKIKKGLVIALVGIILMAITWVNTPYIPQSLAKEALISDNNVDVNDNGDYLSFTPKNTKVTKGFIFYPGAKVKKEAYAPLLKEISKNGYEVVAVDMPFNMAIFGKNKAKIVIEDYPNIEQWSIGGHSLGGVMAAKFAGDNNVIDGVVLLSSYPMGNELKNLGKEVISLWGSKDGVINFNSLYSSKDKLPADTTYVDIEGGNHAQFGDYGKQKGDNEAIISQEEQLDVASKNIVQFLNSIDY